MSTTTAPPPQTTKNEKPPTMKNVRRQEEALADLRQNAAELAETEKRLAGEIAEALADGEDATTLQRERREARDLRSDLEAAEGVLERRIGETRHAARRELARERLATIQKKVGGLCGEAPRRADKVTELVEALEAQLRWLVTTRARRTLWQKEAKFLSGTFGLPMPELKSLEVDGPRVPVDVRQRLRKIAEPRDTLTVGKHGLDAVAIHTRLYGEDSPTPGLVADPDPDPPRAA